MAGDGSDASQALPAHASQSPASTLPEWCKRLPPTKHLSIFLQADWASTTLGPLAQWSSSLQLYATMVLTDSQPSCLYM